MNRFYWAFTVVVIWALVLSIALLFYYLSIKLNVPIKDYYSAGAALVIITIVGIWLTAKYRQDDRIDKKLSNMASINYVDKKIDSLKDDHKYTRDAVDEFREIFEQNFEFQKQGMNQIHKNLENQSNEFSEFKESFGEVQKAIVNLSDNCVIHHKKNK